MIQNLFYVLYFFYKLYVPFGPLTMLRTPRWRLVYMSMFAGVCPLFQHFSNILPVGGVRLWPGV